MKLRFLKTLNNIPETAKSVIDIGCGPGHYCLELSKKKIPYIVGLDFSTEMIEIAKENTKNCKDDCKIEFLVCDFLNFTPDTKFEYSIMMGFAEYFENPLTVIKKAISITQKKVFLSLPKDNGILAYQRKLRYKNRCYLTFITQNGIKELLSGLPISSYCIEKVSRDFFITITI